MLTIKRFSSEAHSIPALTSWYLSDLGEAKGRQELFTKQSPQKLKVLREHAIIESSVSSNRIEGVQIEQKRVATVVFGKSLLKDRGEEEVRGYRQALKWIHEEGKDIPLSEKTILKLHKLTRGEIWDAGKYKEKRNQGVWPTHYTLGYITPQNQFLFGLSGLRSPVFGFTTIILIPNWNLDYQGLSLTLKVRDRWLFHLQPPTSSAN